MAELKHDAGELLKRSHGREVAAWTLIFEAAGDGLILFVRAKRERALFLSSPQVAQMGDEILLGASQRGWTAVEASPPYAPTTAGPYTIGKNVERAVGHTILMTDLFIAIGLFLEDGRYRAARWSPPMALHLGQEFQRAIESGDLRNIGGMPTATGTPQ